MTPRKKLHAVAVAAMAMVLAAGCGTAPIYPASFQVDVDPTGTPTPPPKVVFLGDSYTDPNGGNVTWSSLLAAQKGWQEINLAYGGTGYLRTHTPPPAWGKCTVGTTCPSFSGLVSTVGAADPDAIFILGGRNELGQENVQAWRDGVRDFFVNLRSAAPRASIYVLGPIWDDDPVPSGILTMRDVVSAAALAVPGTCYTDLYNPLLGHPEFVLADGFHPNLAGQEAIKNAVLQFLGRSPLNWPTTRCGLMPPVPDRTR